MSLVRYPIQLLKKDLNDLEYNAKAQYKFNRAATLFWLLNMPGVIGLEFVFPKFWFKISVMYLIQCSLWALVATHFGAMSASLAANNTSEDVGDIADDVDDIHEVTDAIQPIVSALVPDEAPAPDPRRVHVFNEA